MLIKFLISYLIIIQLSVYAQEKINLNSTDTFCIKKHKYKDFFFDSNRQNYLFTTAIKYQHTLPTKAFTSNGIYLHLGLNLARFFSKEIVFGIFYELKPINGFFYKQPKSQEFIDDFNSNFNSNYSDSVSFVTANLLKDRLNGQSMHGGSFGNIGIMLSVFPNRFGGILFSFKQGGETHRIGNVYGNKFIQNGGADNLYFSFSTFTYEVSFKPYSLFKNSYINFNSENESFWKSSVVSFFYSTCNLKDAEINGIKWSTIQGNEFISKYGITKRIGISLGFTIY